MYLLVLTKLGEKRHASVTPRSCHKKVQNLIVKQISLLWLLRVVSQIYYFSTFEKKSLKRILIQYFRFYTYAKKFTLYNVRFWYFWYFYCLESSEFAPYIKPYPFLA